MGRPIRGKAQSRYEIVENVSVKSGSNKKQISVFPVPQQNGGKSYVKTKTLLFFCPETITLHLKKYNMSQRDTFSLVITEGFAIFSLCKVFFSISFYI